MVLASGFLLHLEECVRDIAKLDFALHYTGIEFEPLSRNAIDKLIVRTSMESQNSIRQLLPHISQVVFEVAFII